MERNPVSSSNIHSIGYDPHSETLEVAFINGTVYQYFNVPQQLFDTLMREPSKGRFLNSYIKNAYPFSRVG